MAAFGKGERIAVKDPNDRDEGDDREHLGEYGSHVFLTDHAAVEKREARNRHHQDERRRGQHPGGVAFVGHGGSGIREGQPGRARGQQKP